MSSYQTPLKILGMHFRRRKVEGSSLSVYRVRLKRFLLRNTYDQLVIRPDILNCASLETVLAG